MSVDVLVSEYWKTNLDNLLHHKKSNKCGHAPTVTVTRHRVESARMKQLFVWPPRRWYSQVNPSLHLAAMAKTLHMHQLITVDNTTIRDSRSLDSEKSNLSMDVLGNVDLFNFHNRSPALPYVRIFCIHLYASLTKSRSRCWQMLVVPFPPPRNAVFYGSASKNNPNSGG